MDDFKRRPVNRVAQPPKPMAQGMPSVDSSATPTPAQYSVTPQYTRAAPRAQAHVVATPQPIHEAPKADAGKPIKPKKSKKKRIIWILGIIIAVIGLLAGGAFVWYTSQLEAVNSETDTSKLVTILKDTNPTGFASILKKEGLIRSELAFLIYVRAEGVQGILKPGQYRLSPSETTQEIVAHLKSGNADTFDITFLPGETLSKSRQTLINAGYTAEEVDAALTASYDSPLFAGKPETADLEGYIYGDTYRFGAGTSAKAILEHVFDAFNVVVQKNDLVNKFQANGLSLYEGITLASIVQRESIGGDEPQIAQVFYKRLAIGMMLGSDVTYQYIADKTGVQRDTNLDSPYNTRRYTGLTPGPISAPGIKALLGVANPAPGDYIYFLSGDDDVTYYGKTLEEHEANIANHCKLKCQII